MKESEQDKLSKSSCYSIGIVTDTDGEDNEVFFKFKLKGKFINGNSIAGERSFPRKEDLYLVRFVKDEPMISEILLDEPIPFHIKEAPYNGWEVEPDFSLPRE